jgi:hypothetical protein
MQDYKEGWFVGKSIMQNRFESNQKRPECKLYVSYGFDLSSDEDKIPSTLVTISLPPSSDLRNFYCAEDGSYASK